MSIGLRCPQCGSRENERIPFSMGFECHRCGNVFDPQEMEERQEN